MPSVRSTGKVKWFDDAKGFGFLVPDILGPEVFVHKTDLARSLPTLLTDQRVSYELIDSKSRKGTGKKAANVELVG